MKSAAIRQSFVDFFAARGHRAVTSSPLVPHADATLLFTNAGMVQFKDYFTGAARPDFARAVTVQKCLRVSGKHNDLENVGPSPRHHTFFEMLGNFSFGDYFKAEAIEWAWELVTKVWGLDPARLFATVYDPDDEARELWLQISGLPEARIKRRGEKDNFWAMGEAGPCGPCSEIFVDMDPDKPEVEWSQGTETGRYIEIWNLVFMQYERAPHQVDKLLPKPSVDTGAGLERVAAVLAGVPSNYDTDLFRPILDGAAALAGLEYGRAAEADISLRVVADHLRALAFLLADGVIPANDGRGYVLRRLLRRAVRHGLRLGFEESFLHRLLPLVDEAMAGAYAELVATRAASEATVKAEEERFLSTLAAGSREEQKQIEERRARGENLLEGKAVFLLKDTLGMPIEVIREIAEEERFTIDEVGFEKELAAQRERSRKATAGSQKQMGALREFMNASGGLGATQFVGYIEGDGDVAEKLSIEGVEAQRVVRFDDEGRPSIAGGGSNRLAAGEEGIVIVPRTPFYAESGGQVGDVGEIAWEGGSARVTDTQKDPTGVVYHFVRVDQGVLPPEGPLSLKVFPGHRLPTQRNHTATHLLHATLRQVLGEGVRQAGSLVHPEYLRFDFTCGRPLTAEERAAVERIVNDRVLRAVPVEIVADRSLDEARAAGAMALFGEKYGERVRTVAIPDFSLELCGGCHVRNTGEIGPFVVTAERGVASGVRRIEALTGERALARLCGRDDELARVEAALGAEPGRAEAEVEALRRELKGRDAELAKLRVQLVSGGAAASDEHEVAGIRVVAREVPPAPAGELRDLAELLRGKLASGVLVLGARSEGKVSLIAAVTDDVRARVPAGKLLKAVAALVGGSGGGRDDFAQAGGKLPEELPAALAAVPELVEKLLAAGAAGRE